MIFRCYFVVEVAKVGIAVGFDYCGAKDVIATKDDAIGRKLGVTSIGGGEREN